MRVLPAARCAHPKKRARASRRRQTPTDPSTHTLPLSLARTRRPSVRPCPRSVPRSRLARPSIAADLLLLLAISLAIAGDLLLLMAISWLRLPEGASPSGLWGPQRPDRLRNGAWGCAAAGETLRNGACPHESCFLNARL